MGRPRGEVPVVRSLTARLPAEPDLMLADDRGLAAARCHPCEPFKWVFAPLGLRSLRDP